jgi:hypothetical protein
VGKGELRAKEKKEKEYQGKSTYVTLSNYTFLVLQEKKPELTPELLS